MFEDTVTVFNVIKNNGNITFHRQVISNVFYHKEKILSPDGKYTNVYNIIFSYESLSDWVPKNEFNGSDDTYTLRFDDIIVIGECESINDLTDLQKKNVDYFLIKSVSENLYGENELHNIEVTN